MKAVVTRVRSASVIIEDRVNGEIGQGFLVLLGVGPNDTEEVAVKLADKICNLRIFEDENCKMNRNLEQVGGSILVVSQFTLYADTSSRRPGFSGAAKPELAIPLYERFMAHCRERGFTVEHGEFGADMQVYSQNDGPVTILFDTEAKDEDPCFACWPHSGQLLSSLRRNGEEVRRHRSRRRGRKGGPCREADGL